MAKVTAKSMKDMAHEYGFALAFFNSDPELLKLFKAAITKNQPPEAFVASLQGSKWFKTHSSAYRNNLAQKTSDPATWAAKVNQGLASLADSARSMGAELTTAQLKALNEHALLYGYTDAQLKNSLAQYIKLGASGDFMGQAGTDALTLKQTAFRNGIRVSDSSMQNWVRAIESGNRTTNDYQTWIRNQAKTLAPGVSDQLDSGMDLFDVASPYMQQMASTLEIDPSAIDLFDPTIRNALNSKDKDGKAMTQTLGDFENTLRQDPRWMKTNNARDTFSTNARGILSSFGFVS